MPYKVSPKEYHSVPIQPKRSHLIQYKGEAMREYQAPDVNSVWGFIGFSLLFLAPGQPEREYNAILTLTLNMKKKKDKWNL